MNTTAITRCDVVKRPGYDCIGDHQNCPGCNAIEKRDGKRPKPGYHGRFGGSYFFGVRAENREGHRICVVLEVLGIHYPSTMADFVPECVAEPRGAVLTIHVEGTREGADAETGDCPFVERWCHCEVWGYLLAGEIYERSGIKTRDRDRDLSSQPDALWLELEKLLADVLTREEVSAANTAPAIAVADPVEVS